MKRDQIANLVIFLATIVAGVACLALGHEKIGGGILATAVGHAFPSPLVRTNWGKEPTNEPEDAQ